MRIYVRSRELQPVFARASGPGAGAELEKSKAHGRRHRWCGGTVKTVQFLAPFIECVFGLLPFKILHCNDPSTFYLLMQFAIRYSADLHQGSGGAASPHANAALVSFRGPALRSLVSSLVRSGAFSSPHFCHFSQNWR